MSREKCPAGYSTTVFQARFARTFEISTRPVLAADRRQIIEVHIQRRHALRHGDVERVHVHAIAHPRNRLPVRGHHQPRQRLNWPRRRMIAGNPLRIQQRQFARPHRNALVHGHHAIHGVGQVHVQRNRSGIRSIRWSRNRRRHRHGHRLTRRPAPRQQLAEQEKQRQPPPATKKERRMLSNLRKFPGDFEYAEILQDQNAISCLKSTDS